MKCVRSKETYANAQEGSSNTYNHCAVYRNVQLCGWWVHVWLLMQLQYAILRTNAIHLKPPWKFREFSRGIECDLNQYPWNESNHNRRMGDHTSPPPQLCLLMWAKINDYRSYGIYVYYKTTLKTKNATIATLYYWQTRLLVHPLMIVIFIIRSSCLRMRLTLARQICHPTTIYVQLSLAIPNPFYTEPLDTPNGFTQW